MSLGQANSFNALLDQARGWAYELGFDSLEVRPIERSDHEPHLRQWLAHGYHGEMGYMARNVDLRVEPKALHPGALSAISVAMPYLAACAEQQIASTLADSKAAYIARYALGRDYHKVIRARLKRLGQQLNQWLVDNGHNAFTARPVTDSAPFLEKRFAEQSGLGWIGKHTLHIRGNKGSYHFLGELLTNIPFTASRAASTNHCGSCARCIEICPTQAIVGPYQLDARRCIAYLTIEHRGTIPEELRAPMGNRVFGCDDCQMVCPWNRHAKAVPIEDFLPRHQLDQSSLLALFNWSLETFLKKTEGSPIRRAGYNGWQRNIAVALGNAAFDPEILRALRARLKGCDSLVAEHVAWAINQQMLKAPQKS